MENKIYMIYYLSNCSSSNIEVTESNCTPNVEVTELKIIVQ